MIQSSKPCVLYIQISYSTKPNLPAFLAMERFYACRNLVDHQDARRHARRQEEGNQDVDDQQMVNTRGVTPHTSIFRAITRDLANHPDNLTMYTLGHLYAFREKAANEEWWNNTYDRIYQNKRRNRRDGVTIGALSELQTRNRKRTLAAMLDSRPPPPRRRAPQRRRLDPDQAEPPNQQGDPNVPLHQQGCTLS